IFPYVRSVRLESSRHQAIDELTAVLPRYSKQKIEAIKRGMVLRWEAGYFQDGKPLGEGVIEEFEGVITEVNYRSHYDGADPDKVLKRSHSRNASFALTIKAKDYMYLCQQTPLKKMSFTGSMESVVTEILSSNGLAETYGLRFVIDPSDDQYSLRYNKHNINQSHEKSGAGIGIKGERPGQTVMWALMLLHRRWNSNYDLGLDVFFRGKRLVLRDPNDPEWNDRRKMWSFMSGANVIDDDLVARPGKKVRVVVRCYNPDSGQYHSGDFPPSKIRSPQDKIKLNKAWANLEKDPIVEKVFDIDGIENEFDASKKAESIFAEIAGDGFNGSFHIFGYPSLWHSELIGFADRENIDRPDRNKIVIIDKVVKVYDAEKAHYAQHVYPGFVPTEMINPLTVIKRPSTETGEQSVTVVPATDIPSASGQGFVDQFGSFIREVLSR
ncbi:MAG: hypothetical protein CVV45_15730, partial [Spirochaetae bacterium HGW-Spirochaetae-10]